MAEADRQVSTDDAVKDATMNVQHFIVPPTLAPHVGDLQSIVFYRPKAGHTLQHDSVYAVRLNEGYLDAKAALENERAYVRAAALRAGCLIFYRCMGKNPILIMSSFEDKTIRDGNRAIEAAVDRTRTVRPAKVNRIETGLAEDTTFVRICGPEKVLQIIAKTASQRGHQADIKQHHVQGSFYMNLHVAPGKISDKLRSKVLITHVHDIISSRLADQQLTLRRNGATLEETMNIATDLQTLGARTHLRTNGTIRVTLTEKVTPKFTADLKAAYPGWSVFTDTPINVWANSQQSAPSVNKIPAVTQAVAQGEKAFKLQADYIPHPNAFEAIAKTIGATLLHVVAAKYTDGPMSCFVALPAGADVSLFDAPFAIDEWGLWYAVPVRAPKSKV